MKMSIEEMIKSGCTFEEAADALQDAWDKAVAERECVMKEAEARQTLLKDYEKYLKIIYPSITQKQLEENVAELELTLKTVRDIFHKCNKINELQQKSKEQNKEKIENFADWVEKLFQKTEAEKKDVQAAANAMKAAKTVAKAEKQKSKKEEIVGLDEFLKKMGW